MSTGFRLFLLMVLAFGVIWLSKHQLSDLRFWLHAPRAVERTLTGEEGARVDGILPWEIEVRLAPPQPVTKLRLMEEPSSARYAGSSLHAADLARAVWETSEGVPSDWQEDGAFLSPEGAPEGDAGVALPGGVEIGGVEIGGVESDSEPGGAGAGRREPAGPAPLPETEYVVQRGDTLSEISQKLLGTARRWKEIQDLNGLDDPQVRAGMKLRIPGRTSQE